MKKAGPASKKVDRETRRREFYAAVDSGEMTLQQLLKLFRKMLGMNQREFAKFVEVSPRIIMAFEQGTGNPTIATVEKMFKGSGLQLTLGRKRRINKVS